MASRLTSELVDAIVAILVSHPEGATAADIAAALPDTPDPRTVQRWLDALAEAERITADTTTRPPRYRAGKEATLENGKEEAAELKNDPAVSVASSFGAETSSFPEMFDLAVPVIIQSAMAKSSATIVLQHHAQRNHLTGAVAKDYVRYGHEQLAKLTLDQALAYGLSADEYTRWRAMYDGSVAPSAPPKPAAAPVAATESAPREPQPTEPETAALSRHANAAGAPLLHSMASTQTAPSPVPAPVPAFLPSTVLSQSSASMLGLVQSVTGLSTSAMLETCTQLAKQMVTKERAAIAGVWAAVITQWTQHLATLGTSLMLVTIPLAGLPWLYFRWRTQKATRARPSATEPQLNRSTVLILTLGGFFSLLCSVPFVWILTLVRGFMP